MKIGIINSVYNKSFDKQPLKQYNYLKPLKADSLELSFGAKKMSENFQDDLEKMKSSKKLKNSPVSYLIPLLSSFYNDELDNKKLFDEITKQTRDAQFYFFHMPKKDIEDNQKLFLKEFTFANTVYKAIDLNKTNSVASLKESLKNIISDYTKD